jgi:hypothetical protein
MEEDLLEIVISLLKDLERRNISYGEAITELEKTIEIIKKSRNQSNSDKKEIQNKETIKEKK